MLPWQPDAEALVVVSTTVADDASGRRLAQLALQGRLAACVQLSVIESHYVWEGELQQEPERRLLFKTTVQAYSALERLLLEHHPYAVPMVAAEPLVAVSADYRAWVLQAVRPAPDSDRHPPSPG